MKKTFAIIITAVFAFFGTANAQQKIGHINLNDIVVATPEYKQLSTDIQKQSETLQKALEGMQTDGQKKEKELQALQNDKSTPDAILESKIEELQELGKRIQDFQTKAGEDIKKKEDEGMKVIYEKIKKATKEVAGAENYAYIFDIASGAVVYYPEGSNDITDLVMKKLNITRVPATTAPAGTGKGTK